jgi:hypothetical protein
MSCIGQSDATHNINIAAPNAILFVLVTAETPSGTAFGPITRTM